jgi:dihydroneopterin aldolase
VDKILIRGLMLEVNIGISPQEKAEKQPILIDMDLFVDIKTASCSDLINDTVDYDVVIKRIGELVKQTRFDLIESLIEHIANIILQEFGVYKLRCTLYKPKAIRNTQKVGIAIERYNQNNRLLLEKRDKIEEKMSAKAEFSER